MHENALKFNRRHLTDPMDTLPEDRNASFCEVDSSNFDYSTEADAMVDDPPLDALMPTNALVDELPSGKLSFDCHFVHKSPYGYL